MSNLDWHYASCSCHSLPWYSFSTGYGTARKKQSQTVKNLVYRVIFLVLYTRQILGAQRLLLTGRERWGTLGVNTQRWRNRKEVSNLHSIRVEWKDVAGTSTLIRQQQLSTDTTSCSAQLTTASCWRRCISVAAFEALLDRGYLWCGSGGETSVALA